MIEINVHLKSAISRSRDKELARFVICNDGSSDGALRNYHVESYRGRSTAQLDRRKPSRSGQVRHHKSDAEHVLNLVAKALQAMGYGQPPGGAARRGVGGIDVAARPK
jgi:hypothetical protein